MENLKSYLYNSSFNSNLYAEIAMTYQGCIGMGDKLLYNEPEDMKRFKLHTSGNIVVMGNNTYKSIGGPLPNRVNVVLSNSESEKIISDDKNTPVIIGNDIVSLLSIVEDTFPDFKQSSVHIIGGSQIYNFFEKDIDIWNITIWESLTPKDIINKAQNCDLVYDLKFFKPLHKLIIDNNLKNYDKDYNFCNRDNFYYSFLVLGK